MLTEEMRRLGLLVSQGDPEAADRLARALDRAGYGSATPLLQNADFGPQDLSLFKPKTFKPEKDKKYRVSFAWWGEEILKPSQERSPKFKVLTSGVRVTLGTVVLVGSPQEGSVKYEVMPWIISRRVFEELENIHKVTPLGKFDFIVDSNNPNSSLPKFNFRYEEDNLFQELKIRKNLQEIYRGVLEKVQVISSNFGRPGASL